MSQHFSTMPFVGGRPFDLNVHPFIHLHCHFNQIKRGEIQNMDVTEREEERGNNCKRVGAYKVR